MDAKKKVAAVDGLFTMDPTEPQLIGGKCDSCGSYFFPKFYQSHKPTCPNREVREVLLSRRGKLDSYTIQYFPPPPPFVSPKPFVPYGLGLVALPEGINIIGIMTGIELEDLKRGMDVEMVVDKLYEDEDGTEFMGWKFRPVD
ncbi:MAG: OB-fold domain-containing protein [Syntrophomonadaceae bacterium]